MGECGIGVLGNERSGWLPDTTQDLDTYQHYDWSEKRIIGILPHPLRGDETETTQLITEHSTTSNTSFEDVMK